MTTQTSQAVRYRLLEHEIDQALVDSIATRLIILRPRYCLVFDDGVFAVGGAH
jgi:hypothetical protein